MSSTSANRAYLLQTSGENPGTWGLDPGLNGNFNKIDTNLGGVTTVALSSSNVTLSATQYANGTIRLTGTLTANVQVIFPAIQAWYCIDNQTTGSFVAFLNITGSPGQLICTEQGGATDIFLDGTNVKFRNLPPVGSYLDVCDIAAPLWIQFCTVPPYLTCDGSAFSAVTYPYLNAKLGTTTLPDLRGRARFYLDGGTGRITTAGSGIDGTTRFSAGGAQTVTLVTANLPPYTPAGTVPINFATGQRSIDGGSGTVVVATRSDSASSGNVNWYTGSLPNFGGSTTIPTQSLTGTAQGGVSTAINNMPPAQISGVTLIRAA